MMAACSRCGLASLVGQTPAILSSQLHPPPSFPLPHRIILHLSRPGSLSFPPSTCSFHSPLCHLLPLSSLPLPPSLHAMPCSSILLHGSQSPPVSPPSSPLLPSSTTITVIHPSLVAPPFRSARCAVMALRTLFSPSSPATLSECLPVPSPPWGGRLVSWEPPAKMQSLAN